MRKRNRPVMGKWSMPSVLRNGITIALVVIWFLAGTLPFTDGIRNWFRYDVLAAEADVDATASTTQAIHNGASPTIVVISNTDAYAFYVDSGGQCVYSKTTTLNNATPTWNAAVQIDSQTDCIHVAVWYDRWTPGDVSGNYIYIATMDSGSDDIWYNRLDVSSDTRLLTASPVSISSSTAPAKTNAFAAGGTLPAITKSTSGIIYAGTINNLNATSSWVHKCSATCETASNWSDESPDFETTTYTSSDNDAMILMPQPDGDIMLIAQYTANNRLMSKIYDASLDSWSTFVSIDSNVVENATYDGTFGATIDRSTFEIYIAYSDSVAAANSDVRTAIYDPIAATWTAKTDAATNVTGAITSAKISIDSSSGTIYAVYTRRTTQGTAATGNVYFKSSSDDMTSWGAESAALNTTTDDLYGVRVPIITNEHVYVTWYDLAADDINGNTVADLTPITSSIEQAVYRVFNSADSTDVGSALATQNNAATLVTKGNEFRIRLLLRVSSANLAISGQQFKLQFSAKGGGACSSSSLVYQDVTTTSTIAYRNQATPADGASLTSNANDPTNGAETIVNQTYEEANNFTNSVGAINTSQNGKWDFSLVDYDGLGATAYCFRVVKTGGDFLNTYTQYPDVTTGAAPLYNQSNYRFFSNADSTDVGGALAAQNTRFTLTSVGQAFRLRMLIDAGTNGVALDGAKFKLQAAPKGLGTCTSPTGSYTDITSTTSVAYNNNATPADGAALTNNANDPTGLTARNQTYEEANNFQNSQLAIGAGETGKWDFSLIDNGMAGGTYCIRAVGITGTVLTTYSQIPEISSVVGVIDDTVSTTGLNHQGSSPTAVFTSTTTGYMFYIDSTGAAVYRKTTDGGFGWSAPVTVDSQTDVTNISVWYDRWTPGDSGNFIHIATVDSGNDDMWYTRLDTTTDTLSTTISAVTNTSQGGTFDNTNKASISKATNGTLYLGIVDNSDTYILDCTSTCTTATNWFESTIYNAVFFTPSTLVLLPQAAGDMLALDWDSQNDRISSQRLTGSSWSAITNVVTGNNENTTYRAGFSVVLDPVDFTVYLMTTFDAATLGTNDDIQVYSYSSSTWSQKTNILTDTARGVTGVTIGRDNNTGTLYGVYTVRTTAGTASTGTIYYVTSTDGGTTWSAEKGPISYASTDIHAARINFGSSDILYLTYVDDTNDDIYGVPVAYLTSNSGLMKHGKYFFQNTKRPFSF